MRTRALVRAAITCVAIAGVVREGRAQRADSAAAPNDPHTAQPERPTVATHAGTVAPGWV
ncbi:MAG: hypothetical protein M3Y30_10345 [Gemmatimonadota bacterium]|nr:hypothetical protein [Gemmatimonadota bacterium]